MKGYCILTAAIAVTLAGCTTQAPDGTPLGDDVIVSLDGEGAICGSAARGTEWTYGHESIENHGDEAVVIHKVNLVNAEDARVVEAALVPDEVRNDIAGLGAGWPTRGTPQSAYDRLEGIPGAVLPPVSDPIRDDELFGLALHLEVQPGGSFDGVSVDYTREGSERIHRSKPSQWRFTLEEDCSIQGP